MGQQVKFPTYKILVGRRRPFRRYQVDAVKSLVKVNGEWLEITGPHAELLAVAEKFYIGGYTYPLTPGEAADLPPQYVEEVS